MKKLILILLCLVILIACVACSSNISVVLNNSFETNGSNETDSTNDNSTEADWKENAKLSADIQTVRNMNTVLAVEFIGETPTDVNAVIDALNQNGYTVEDTLAPKAKNQAYYWFATKNVIVLVEMENDIPKAVVYPADEELAAAFMVAEDSVKYNLSGIVK